MFIDHQPDSTWGIVETDKFLLNTKKDKRIFVQDNFYENPDAVREFALLQYYFDDEGYLGMRTRKQFLFTGIKERFEELIGEKITRWEVESMNGRFQTCKSGIPLVYHCDDQRWAAMIYLSPDAPPQAGTSFYRHKETKIRHNSEEGIMQCFNQHTFLDPSPYELVDTVGNFRWWTNTRCI